MTIHDDRIPQAINGDEAALTSLLVDAYDALAFDLGSRIPSRLRAHIDVDDLLQEVYTVAWKRVTSFEYKGPGSFLAWIRTIARRKLVDEIRAVYATKRGGAHSIRVCVNATSTHWLAPFLVDGGASPSSAAARGEVADEVNRAIGTLSDKHQRVLKFRFMEGLTAAATGAQMNSSEHAIHMMTRRALQKLRKKLGSRSRFFKSK